MQMARKKRGIPFSNNYDERRNLGRALESKRAEIPTYKRYSKTVVAQVVENNRSSSLKGVKLRPSDAVTNPYGKDTENNNDIIDLIKLNQAYETSLHKHRHFALKRRSTKHTPNLKLNKVHNKGFGVQARYHCTGCTFRSDLFKLYNTTNNGSCLTNVQAAVAFSKSAIKPSDAEFLFAALNVNGPSRQTLQTHFSNVNQSSSQVLEAALAANRGVVRDYLSVRDGSCDAVPAVAVSFDGQYDKPLFHGYDGKSSSVSEPVLEGETGLNLLVSHAVVSKLDGSYQKNKGRCSYHRPSLQGPLFLNVLVDPDFSISTERNPKR